MTRNDGGTVTVDIDGKYAESSHTHDDRYFTETESDARFQPLENQRLSTSDSPTFANVYNNGWFRNYGYSGLYNQDYANHWYATSDSQWNAAGGNASTISIAMRTGGHQGTVRGYLYADSSNQIGLLANDGNWGLRMTSTKDVEIVGDLTVTGGDVFSTRFGIADSGMDCYMEVGDGNPTEDGINYGGTFTFYGDKSVGLSHLYFGGAYVTNNFVVGGRITENSSIRYKKDIETLEGGLDKVLAMRGVTYIKKDTGIKEVGLIAEELAEILPEVVGFDTQGQPDSVSYSRLTAILVEAIKDLKKEIDELKGKK
jgi:hypothetical protein